MPSHRPRVSSPYVVGREEELAALDATLERALEGESATVLVAGVAGVGKSRLVEELSRRATSRGFQRLLGGAVELGGGDLAYGPLVAVVRQIVKREGVGDLLALVGSSATELARLVPELAAAVDGDDTSARRVIGQTHLYGALASLFDRYAWRKPLLLVLEDLHWADRSTLEALPYLVRELAGSRVALIGTYRDDELAEGHHLRRLVAELVRGELAGRLDLRPLTRPQQAEQLAGILGVPPTAAMVARVHDRAEGNPFFAEELLASSLGAEGEIPETIRELLLARLVLLPEATRTVLRAAAVVGRRVPHDLLLAISGLEHQALDDALRAAVEHHVLTPQLNHFTFRHALLRETVATTVLPGEAQRLHAAIAAALAAGTASSRDDANPAASLAMHWDGAGQPRLALEASLVAARRSAQMYGFSEALEHYQRSLRVWDRVEGAPDAVGVALVVVLQEAADSAHLAGQTAIAAGLARQALLEVDASEQPVLAGVLYGQLGRYLWMAADGEGSLAAHQRAVELVPAEPPSRARARVLAGLGQMLMLVSRYDHARVFCEEAIRVARAVAAPTIEGHALNSLGVVRALTGDDLDAGIGHLREARRIAEDSSDDPDDMGRAFVNLVAVLFEAGRWTESAAEALVGIEVIDDLGMQRRKGVWLRCAAAEALTRLGRWEEAERLVAQAFGLAPQGIDLLVAHLIRGTIHLGRGELADARDHLAAALQPSDRVLDQQINGPLFTAAVELAVCERNQDRALELAEQGWARLGHHPNGRYAAPLCATAARAAADRSAHERHDRPAVEVDTNAQVWLDRCTSALDPTVAAAVPAASLATCRAEVSRASGDGAAELWQDAIARWQQLGDPYRTAYAQWRLAETLCAAPGSREQATAAARQAHRTAVDFGARLIATEVEALARRARLDLHPSRPGTQPPPHPYGLTTREQEILALLAAGRTNREIGDRLFISHRTVGNHVSNLLAKLGASRRMEAAAIAHREGLTSPSANDPRHHPSARSSDARSHP